MPNFKKNPSPAMKRSAYKMKGYSYPGTSPVKELTNEEKLNNLREFKDEYPNMKREEQIRFNKAWTKFGGQTMKIKP